MPHDFIKIDISHHAFDRQRQRRREFSAVGSNFGTWLRRFDE
jgi:hypothetical protein